MVQGGGGGGGGARMVGNCPKCDKIKRQDGNPLPDFISDELNALIIPLMVPCRSDMKFMETMSKRTQDKGM